MDHKAPDAFRSISEVADELDLPQHVLRFWETRVPRHQADEAWRRAALLSSRRHQSSAWYPPSPLRRGLHHSRRAANCASRAPNSWPPFGRRVRRSRRMAPRRMRISPKKRCRLRPRPPTSSRGLGGRLSALIGRDLGDRADDLEGAASRRSRARRNRISRLPTARSMASRICRRRPSNRRRLRRRRRSRQRVPPAGSRAKICASCTPSCMSLPNAVSS